MEIMALNYDKADWMILFLSSSSYCSDTESVGWLAMKSLKKCVTEDIIWWKIIFYWKCL